MSAMKRSLRLAVLTLAATLAALAGCGSNRPAAPPEPPPLSTVAAPAAPHARVRFATDAKMPVALFSYADAACSQAERQWPVLASQKALVGPPPQRLGLPLWDFPGRSASEHHVSSEAPMHGLFHVQDTHSDAVLGCAVAWSYRFEAGKDYEVFFRWADKSCRADIYWLDSSGAGGQTIRRLQQHATDLQSERAGTCRQLYRKRVLS
jgi:predicted small lipoprotein YifL